MCQEWSTVLCCMRCCAVQHVAAALPCPWLYARVQRMELCPALLYFKPDTTLHALTITSHTVSHLCLVPLHSSYLGVPMHVLCPAAPCRAMSCCAGVWCRCMCACCR